MARYSRHFKPAVPFDVPLMLLIPTASKEFGVSAKVFPDIKDGILFYGNFKTYGGTERDVNGLYSIIDTAEINCWYRPDITSDCRIGVPSTGAIYEVLNEPENVNLRNQYLNFKVRRIKGGA